MVQIEGDPFVAELFARFREVLRVKPRAVVAALIAAALGGFASQCPGQTVDTFEQWWAKISAIRKEGPDVDLLKLHYKIEIFSPPPTLDEISELEKKVKGHPEHPDLIRLKDMQRRLRDPSPYAVENSMWRLNGRWRWNTTEANNAFFDSAWDKDHAWQLHPDFVRILDPRRAATSPFRIDLFVGTLMNDSAAFINGDLGSFVEMMTASFAPKRSNDGKSWVAKVENTDSSGAVNSLDAKGTWDPVAGWGTIEQVRWVSRPKEGQTQGEIRELRGWRFSPQLHLGMASDSRELDLDGTMKKRYTLIEAVGFSESEFDRLLQIPTADTPDPSRGQLTFSRIEDYSSLEPVVRDRDGKPAGATAPMVAARSAVSHMRWAGWAVGASVVLIIVVLRITIRRRMAV